MNPSDIAYLKYSLIDDAQFISIFKACNDLKQYDYDKLCDIQEHIDQVNNALDTLIKILYTVK